MSDKLKIMKRGELPKAGQKIALNNAIWIKKDNSTPWGQGNDTLPEYKLKK